VSRAVCVLLALTATASAQDAFEIQVYDAETAPKGDPGIELHLNHHLIANASNQTHTTFEPHYGMTDWLELGGYVQTSTTRGDEPEFAGAKLRAKLRLPHRYWEDRLAFAANFELSGVPSQFETNVWGSEVRPIVELRLPHFLALVNPILATDLAGSLAGHPQFEPCAKLSVLLTQRIGVGIEAYGGFGPLDDLGSESVQRGFAVFDYAGRTFDVNVGVGVNHGSPDHPVAKLIFGMHP
jgi:hypothetical protein